jgi:glucokinase
MSALNAPAPLCLVADIGGTNTRVALARGDAILTETVARFRNADHSDLEEILKTFLHGQSQPDCTAASVAIAGPVRNGRGTLTNRNWTIGPEMLRRATGAETVAILNDLQAQGHALGRIANDNLRVVLPGEAAAPDAARIVIGVGTGFNIAPVHLVGGQRLVPAAEAGHVSLPVRNEAELELAAFIEEDHGFAAVEDVLSGRGLERVYAWHSRKSGEAQTKDAARIMADLADGTDLVSAEAVATFVRFFGRVAGDLALDHLPLGGVFLSGGVSRAMAPHFDRFGFREAFFDKGRFSDLMGSFSVSVIEDDFAALTGTAANLAALMNTQSTVV